MPNNLKRNKGLSVYVQVRSFPPDIYAVGTWVEEVQNTTQLRYAGARVLITAHVLVPYIQDQYRQLRQDMTCLNLLWPNDQG